MERFWNRILNAFFKKRQKEEKPKFSKKGPSFDLLKNEGKNIAQVSKSLHMLKPAEIQLLLDNIVYPEDMDYHVSERKKCTTECCTNKMSNCYSKEEILCVVYNQGTNLEVKSSEDSRKSLSMKFTTTDFAKNMPTFWRLKRKLQAIEEMYPELYYRDQNVFEIFATSATDKVVRSDVEDVNLLWI